MTRFNVVFSVLMAACVLFAQVAGAEVTRLSEPVAVTDDAEIFGAPLDESARATSLEALLDSPGDFVDTAVKVDARISQVCQKKGCFFIAQDGESVARITFVDYSFFVPTDSGGKTVTIVGTFDRQTLSEDQARHYAQDAGGDPARVRGPQAEYSIVATSVIVPRS